MNDSISLVHFARFWIKVDLSVADGCWPWTGTIIPGKGYGSFKVNGQAVRVHRFAYELLVGPIPAGLQIDHLCRNRACVNPAHMEPVTNRENVLRGKGPSAENARKTHCARGHPFTPENVYRQPSRPHSRECRECARSRWRLRARRA